MNFYKRLANYYSDVAKVLRGEANAASIFPNSTDRGQSREDIYVQFLKTHAPSKCDVFLGGFLFHSDGTESKQQDIIITTDTTPRYNFLNSQGNGKSFSPVEGTLGVASIKSSLDKKELHDALLGMFSIPPTESLEGRHSPLINIKAYDDWPYKIIYATDGINGETIMNHLKEFYELRPNIPISRRPNIIHVAGKYVIFRATENQKSIDLATKAQKELSPGDFHLFDTNPDLQSITEILDRLQGLAMASTHIRYSYTQLSNALRQAP